MIAMRLLVVFFSAYGLLLSGPLALPAHARSRSCETNCASNRVETVCDPFSAECSREDAISQSEPAPQHAADDDAIPPWILAVGAMGMTVWILEWGLSTRRRNHTTDRRP
jgi:hypothetical protein